MNVSAKKMDEEKYQMRSTVAKWLNEGLHFFFLRQMTEMCDQTTMPSSAIVHSREMVPFESISQSDTIVLTKVKEARSKCEQRISCVCVCGALRPGAERDAHDILQ